MKQYFDLIANEFAAQSAQIKEFVKSHGPTIGAAHEIILRSFLKKYLPQWVSIGHGFVLSQTGSLSRECDILIYNSTYYSPLYQIEDFVVLAPESVLSVVEVKTVLNQRMLHDSMDNLIAVKKLRSDIETVLVIFNPPSLRSVSAYIESYDFAGVEDNLIPDRICGLTKFSLDRHNYVDAKGIRGIGFVSSESASAGAVFEHFYHQLYTRIEMEINKNIKDGIDNVWEINGSDVKIHGRLRYLTSPLTGHKLAAKVKVQAQ